MLAMTQKVIQSIPAETWTAALENRVITFNARAFFEEMSVVKTAGRPNRKFRHILQFYGYGNTRWVQDRSSSYEYGNIRWVQDKSITRGSHISHDISHGHQPINSRLALYCNPVCNSIVQVARRVHHCHRQRLDRHDSNPGCLHINLMTHRTMLLFWSYSYMYFYQYTCICLCGFQRKQISKTYKTRKLTSQEEWFI